MSPIELQERADVLAKLDELDRRVTALENETLEQRAERQAREAQARQTARSLAESTPLALARADVAKLTNERGNRERELTEYRAWETRCVNAIAALTARKDANATELAEASDVNRRAYLRDLDTTYADDIKVVDTGMWSQGSHVESVMDLSDLVKAPGRRFRAQRTSRASSHAPQNRGAGRAHRRVGSTDRRARRGTVSEGDQSR